MKRKNWIGVLPFYLLVLIGCIGIVNWFNDYRAVAGRSKPVYQRQVFVVDAGHGGIDGGATSCTGVLESGINLQIALRLNDLLNFLGYDTVMIRTTDTAIHTEGETIAAQKLSDLRNRVQIANGEEGNILISIHQNTFSDRRYSGAQVFYGGGQGSYEFAKILQNNFTQTLNAGSNRLCKKADGVYLMEHISVCGVLVECGFLSNPEEEALLRSAKYQKDLCCVIAASASTYLNT